MGHQGYGSIYTCTGMTVLHDDKLLALPTRGVVLDDKLLLTPRRIPSPLGLEDQHEDG